MFRSIKRWLKAVELQNKEILNLFFFIFIETALYIFFPITYANIVSFTSEQNIKRAFLWAIISFMVQILSLILIALKSTFLNKTNTIITNNLLNHLTSNNKDLIKPTFTIISDYIFVLNSCFVFFLKLLSIVLIAGIYSTSLMLYTFIAVFICFIISVFITRKQKIEKQPNTPNSNLFVDIIWATFTLLIMLAIINLFNNQNITLTVFLLISTFINTHLTKPNFNTDFVRKTQELNKNLDIYFKFKNLK